MLARRPLPVYSMVMRTPHILAAATLVLTACAGGSDGAIPSLAKRDYELSDEDIARLLSGEVEAADPVPVAAQPLPSDMENAVQSAFAAHQQGQTAFQNAVRAVEQKVSAARGAAPLSEPWIAAQMAVSRLDSVRSPSVGAIGKLDSIYVYALDTLGLERAMSVQQRRDKVAEDVAYQSRIVAALATSLRDF